MNVQRPTSNVQRPTSERTTCPRCDGSGELITLGDIYRLDKLRTGEEQPDTCPLCEGRGEI
jgi:DnaJ-class molecular chaperone